MIQKLKNRWEVESNWSLVLIFLVFAITGSSVTFVRKPAFDLLGITDDTSMWLVVPLYILIIFPTYQVLLMIYGTLLGQFRFFWNFEKKMLRRFGLKL